MREAAPGIGHNSLKGQTIIRSNPEHGFTRISNALLQDSRVSYETRGLLAELLSRPDDWHVTVVSIVKSGPAGRDKVYRMLKEAEKFGYAASARDRNGDGSFQKQQYVITDDPKLLIARAAAEIERLEQPLPEKPEVVVPFPSRQDEEKPRKQATSWKPVSGQPLPENPDTAEPLPANPQHTKERYIQTTERTKEESPLGKIAAAVAAGFASAVVPVAAAPSHPAEQVMQAAAECWQTPKAQMAAASNAHEARAQKQVWVTPTGVVEVAGDFRAELVREFHLVDLHCGLATAAVHVKPDFGAIRAMQDIRRQFGFMQNDAAGKEKRAASYQKQSEKPAPKSDRYFDGVL